MTSDTEVYIKTMLDSKRAVLRNDLEKRAAAGPVPTFTISESDLLRVAYLEISDSPYTLDQTALDGFCLGLGVHRGRLRSWLQERLGEKFPVELPKSWIFAEGL